MSENINPNSEEKIEEKIKNSSPELSDAEANSISDTVEINGLVETQIDEGKPASVAESIPSERYELKPFQEIISSLTRLESSLVKSVQEILDAFQEKLAFDRFKEDQITRLHSELQDYKSDLIVKTSRPLINGIIRLHDDIGRIVDALEKRDPADLTPDRFFKLIDGFKQDLELLLNQNDVETYAEAGDIFEPHRQKALMTVPTTDTAVVGRIAARLRLGFEQGGAILQKERVAVYALANSEPAPGVNQAQENSNQAAQDQGEAK
jgi:molecular chaperone GrpE